MYLQPAFKQALAPCWTPPSLTLRFLWPPEGSVFQTTAFGVLWQFSFVFLPLVGENLDLLGTGASPSVYNLQKCMFTPGISFKDHFITSLLISVNGTS